MLAHLNGRANRLSCQAKKSLSTSCRALSFPFSTWRTSGTPTDDFRREFQVVSAPLEQYSDRAFRSMCFQLGATNTFTEMARLEGLSRDCKKGWMRVLTDPDVPTVVQILPSSEEELNRTLEMWKEKKLKTPAEWNINVGCPSKKLTKIGLGCAMVKDVERVARFIEILRKSKVPVSVKLRLGKNQEEKSRKVYLNLIRDTDADYYIVHGRHGEQKKCPADKAAYQECLNTGKVIWANGGINSVQAIHELRSEGLHGVMIGRAAVQNPLIFRHYWEFDHNPNYSPSESDHKYVRDLYCHYFDRYYADGEDLQAMSGYKRRIMKHIGERHEHLELDE
eukprot:TRINITY_DN8935_c0_g1_i1.p1 TRINITY_DN8935_c0_g1~~TRINITY_DN8935_c0_g1_i1.p1  ORF type:complete len:336 (-),score=59.01 TRINITY_DN8935_c0_g1_i1:170-1177(-)